jgi:hypothetical protein
MSGGHRRAYAIVFGAATVIGASIFLYRVRPLAGITFGSTAVALAVLAHLGVLAAIVGPIVARRRARRHPRLSKIAVSDRVRLQGLTQFRLSSRRACLQTIGTTGHAESDMREGRFCAILFQAARNSLILNGEMSEWSIEHAWKSDLFTRADAHKIPPTHSRSTTSPYNDVRRRVPVNHGVDPGFRGVCDTV